MSELWLLLIWSIVLYRSNNMDYSLRAHLCTSELPSNKTYHVFSLVVFDTFKMFISNIAKNAVFNPLPLGLKFTGH